MPPPNMGHIQYTLQKIAHICGSMLPKSWLKRTSIDPSTVQYLIKSENPSGLPSLVYSTMEKFPRIIALVILIILAADIASFDHAKPLPQAQQAKLEENLKTLSAKLDAYELILGKQKYLAGDERRLGHLPYGTMLEKAGSDLMTTKGPNVTSWFNDL
ncbi:hypothetical protein C8J57DRAFT_1628553 [Mycena rebaudengoi]|nr:hypothetical protein C8J57DRAFT_1628553 [Mycena rebaudengoi]